MTHLRGGTQTGCGWCVAIGDDPQRHFAPRTNNLSGPATGRREARDGRLEGRTHSLWHMGGIWTDPELPRTFTPVSRVHARSDVGQFVAGVFLLPAVAPFNSPCAMTIEPPQSEATTPSPVSAPPPKTGTRIAAGALTALYVGIIVAVAVLVRPPTTAALGRRRAAAGCGRVSRRAAEGAQRAAAGPGGAVSPGRLPAGGCADAGAPRGAGGVHGCGEAVRDES